MITRQKTKVRIPFATNLFSKIIESGRFLGKTLGNVIGNLDKKKPLKDLAVPFAKDALPNLATKATSSMLDKFERKISGKGAVRAGKWFAPLISYENVDDTTKIVESLEKLGLLIYSVSETINHEIEKQEEVFPLLIAPMTSLLIQPVLLHW